ncbi:MAG TPA: hypothetical protein HPP83_02035 [Candidatus Hydrogenedentes bacterium]|nr:hypothetical protein [Candidatus Hydrogenedentota bacterium]
MSGQSALNHSGPSISSAANEPPRSADIIVAEERKPPLIVELGAVSAPNVDIDWLCSYIGRVCGSPPARTHEIPGAQKGLTLVVLGDSQAAKALTIPVPSVLDKHEGYAIRSVGQEDRPALALMSESSGGLRQAILHLIREMRQDKASLRVRPLEADEAPWIPVREVMFLTAWSPPPDPRLDIMKYDKERLDAYTDMFMSFGYNGVQILDNQSAYLGFSENIDEGVEKNEIFSRAVADRARLHAGSCSLFVWGGEIGAGDPEYDRAVDAWLDSDMKGNEADDPDLRRAYSRWYARYARLADCADRLICHYGEPYGRLSWKSYESQLTMHRVLMDHFSERNPSIQFAVNLWRSFGRAGRLDNELYGLIAEKKFAKGHIFLEPGMPDGEPPMADGLWSWDDRRKLRQTLATGSQESYYQIGVWSDYLEDMESDGVTFMSVNDQIIKEFYNQVRQRLEPIKPTVYWCTMDANHIVNIYSMYCAARLLWNPDYDTHELLVEITNGIWGPCNGAKVLHALETIRDTRSGPDWQTYCFSSGLRQVGTDDPADDLRRAKESIDALQAMEREDGFVPKFPLPFNPMVFTETILPNLRQIAIYAENRIIVDEIVQRDREGASLQELRALKKRLRIVPSFDTWVGHPEQLENAEMRRLLQRLGHTRVAAGPLSWDEDAGMTLLQMVLNGPAKAFDGDYRTTWEPGSPWRDEATLRPPRDIGYAWEEPQIVSQVVVCYASETCAPRDTGDIEIQYYDGNDWQTAGVQSSACWPGPEKTWRCTYDIAPAEGCRFRVFFPKPMKGGGRPVVAEMSFWHADKLIETPPDRGLPPF